MAQFMMLLNVSGTAPTGSPEEMQEILKRYGAWSQKLAETGKLVNGVKLGGDRGRLLRSEGERGWWSMGRSPRPKRWSAASSSLRPTTTTRRPRWPRHVRTSNWAAQSSCAKSTTCN